MTTTHKALLIQARDALLSACGGRCNAEYNPCEAREVADALTAAIDAPEPKGLFIDMIARHEGLAEELRDLPEPYDQQALEPCPVCGWKAIVPGEPCLMCERNARMLAPEPEPVAWRLEGMEIVEFTKSEYHDGPEWEPLYTRPPAVREPLSDETIFQIACGAADEMWPGVGGVGWTEEDAKFYRIFCRKIEAAIGVKP